DQFPHRPAVVVDMLQHMICDHYVIGAVRHRQTGDIDAKRNTFLRQVGGLITRVVIQNATERLFWGKVKNTFAREPVAAVLNDPEPQQPMPFPTAALSAARIPARRSSDADHHADMPANRTG